LISSVRLLEIPKTLADQCPNTTVLHDAQDLFHWSFGALKNDLSWINSEVELAHLILVESVCVLVTAKPPDYRSPTARLSQHAARVGTRVAKIATTNGLCKCLQNMVKLATCHAVNHQCRTQRGAAPLPSDTSSIDSRYGPRSVTRVFVTVIAQPGICAPISAHMCARVCVCVCVCVCVRVRVCV
jgi:hypothetical protein